MDISLIQKIKLGWNFIRGNYLKLANGLVDILAEQANKILDKIQDKVEFGKGCVDIVIVCKCVKDILDNHSDKIPVLRLNAIVGTIDAFEVSFASLEDANLKPEEINAIADGIKVAVQNWKEYKKGK